MKKKTWAPNSFIVRTGVTNLEDKLKRKRGRPRKEESYRSSLIFLANDDHKYMKEALEEELNKNGGAILREAIETLYKFKGDDTNG